MRELEKERTRLRENLKSVETKQGIRPAEKPAKSEKPKQLKLGDSVRVLSMNHDAIVSSLPDKNGKLFVRMGILRTQVSLDDVILIGEDDSAAKAKGARRAGSAPSFSKAAGISPEINLIGNNVDEACAALSKYLDDALLAHLDPVRIIHGKGTGALREEIQKYLRTVPGVASVADENIRFGGTGVTIVTLD